MSTAHRCFLKELVKLTQEQDLRKGKALHAEIIKSDSFSNVYLANCLVNLYAKCGQLSKAKLSFELIRNKDDVSWSTIINAYAKGGGPNSYVFVMDLFKRMRVENSISSGHSFAGVFTVLSNLGDSWVGKQVHSLAMKTAQCGDVVVGSSILNMYCKSGLVTDAQQVFDRMPERNSVSWATMISGYASCGMAEEAVGFFKMVIRGQEEAKKGYRFFLTSMLSAFIIPELFDSGRGIHCFAVKTGLILVQEVRNSLLTMYMKCGGMTDALLVFSMSTEKNPIMWSAIITGLAQIGNSKKALVLFSNMHYSGVKPSEYTFVGVINACSDIIAVREGKEVHCYAIKMGFGNQIYIISSLIDMYAKSGCVSDARKGFDCLQAPDVVLWTSMIAGYIQNGENEEALSLYARMEVEGIPPNEWTLASVLKGCSSLAAIEQGKQIHAHAIKYGFSREVTIGSSLSSMYAKCGCIDEGRTVFQWMTSRDVVSWNVMISGLAQNGCSNNALELFEEMVAEGMKPDNITFVNVLSACSHMGLVEKSWHYFQMISKEFALVPGLEHYACMVDAYSRAGRLLEAKQFIESVTIDHGMCLWRILLGSCRNYHHYELGAYAGEKLMELGSQESSAYVMLSRIYVALGKPDDAERVMKLMMVRGVGKEPGCSWIELKNRVHVFVVGDQKHPEVGNIRTWLRILTKQIMGEDCEPTYDLSYTS